MLFININSKLKILTENIFLSIKGKNMQMNGVKKSVIMFQNVGKKTNQKIKMINKLN